MAITGALGTLVVLVRLFRFGDGVTRRYFNRPLNLALDLPLSPELVRLLDSTVSRPKLILGTVAALAGLVGIGVLVASVFRRAELYFSARTPRMIFAGIVGVTLVLSPFVASDGGRGLRVGAFGASLVPVALRQTSAWLAVDQHRIAATDEIRGVNQRLRHSARGIERLHGANVFLFLVESYGETVIDRPDLAREMAPTYAAVANTLRAAGFDVASGLLASPTYAGRSWLAQETLATGVAATDTVVDTLLQRERPMTMARIFRDAGYRTVLVQPGSTHPALFRWLYDFEQVYSAWDLDYHGPDFLWAPMPDQYVVDFVHRREVAQASRPLLIEYALVSSHAPWSSQPSIVTDWARMGDGHIFNTLPIAHFPVGWTNLSDGASAYVRSVAYDLDVIAQYITQFVPGDSLVIVLGDHQPVAEVTRWSASYAVPVHAISRNRMFIDAFRARGYTSGMWPRRSEKPPGLETFLPNLLADFSNPQPGPLIR